ncbi:hypothetical protein GCM10023208_22280 [Erythrobacter westpacificensis]|uniref:Helix-hairpin-helix domain-containing protein n=1 Tax=Erythrobacter westpacificensis TaxID=1055231 RepID=A0ABP9KI42_9SPHN
MRKIVLAASMAGTALTLAACGDTSDVPSDVETMEPVEQIETYPDAVDVVANASTASAEELVAVEGVSQELADAIVAGQPYDDVIALNTVLLANGTEEEAAMVLENVFVPVNLNTATAEQIALIPGMTDRMVGEFLEYQPYENMDEFDREIGKYVDEDEVARLRRYVTL